MGFLHPRITSVENLPTEGYPFILFVTWHPLAIFEATEVLPFKTVLFLANEGHLVVCAKLGRSLKS